jgi:hypothetical protein
MSGGACHLLVGVLVVSGGLWVTGSRVHCIILPWHGGGRNARRGIGTDAAGRCCGGHGAAGLEKDRFAGELAGSEGRARSMAQVGRCRIGVTWTEPRKEVKESGALANLIELICSSCAVGERERPPARQPTASTFGMRFHRHSPRAEKCRTQESNEEPLRGQRRSE